LVGHSCSKQSPLDGSSRKWLLQASQYCCQGGNHLETPGVAKIFPGEVKNF